MVNRCRRLAEGAAYLSSLTCQSIYLECGDWSPHSKECPHSKVRIKWRFFPKGCQSATLGRN